MVQVEKLLLKGLVQLINEEGMKELYWHFVIPDDITVDTVTKERQPPEIITCLLMKVHTTTYEVYLLNQNKN